MPSNPKCAQLYHSATLQLLSQCRCSGPTEIGAACAECGEGEDVRDIEDQASSSPTGFD